MSEKPTPRILDVSAAVLSKNDDLAEHNRSLFADQGVVVLNLLSSPGSGKTELLRRTLTDLKGRVKAGVIVGDLETENDAVRIRESGAPAIQITTGTMCHLEADMVARAAESLDLHDLGLLIIENVGNLVCPAAYDLGEEFRVVLLSVTEGEDKPLKYPTLFKSAHVVLLTKTDIAEAVGFNRDAAVRNIHRVAPSAALFEVSARSGDGMAAWYAWLEALVARRRSP